MEALSFYIAQIVGLNKDCLQREHSMTYNKKFSIVQKSLSASSAQCHLLVLSSEPIYVDMTPRFHIFAWLDNLLYKQ